MLQNLVTNEMYPARAQETTQTMQLLETLGRTLDEDFMLLLPEETEEDPKYILEAYMTVNPSGWDPRAKLGERLAAIHGPVPGYGAKLEGSMDRFFTRTEAGKYVKRANWTVSVDQELFAFAGGTMHAHDGDQIEELDDIEVEKVL